MKLMHIYEPRARLILVGRQYEDAGYVVVKYESIKWHADDR